MFPHSRATRRGTASRTPKPPKTPPADRGRVDYHDGIGLFTRRSTPPWLLTTEYYVCHNTLMRPTLKQLRQDRGLTQEQLAHAAGTTQGSISQWESGAKTPRLPAAARLATALGVKLETITTAITPEQEEQQA